jgi:hypothetical protein
MKNRKLNMLIGAAGVGKSKELIKLAEELGMDIIIIEFPETEETKAFNDFMKRREEDPDAKPNMDFDRSDPKNRLLTGMPIRTFRDEEEK